MNFYYFFPEICQISSVMIACESIKPLNHLISRVNEMKYLIEIAKFYSANCQGDMAHQHHYRSSSPQPCALRLWFPYIGSLNRVP